MKQGAPYNPPVGDGLTDRARNLLTGNPLRWAVLHEVRPYSGGERRGDWMISQREQLTLFTI